MYTWYTWNTFIPILHVVSVCLCIDIWWVNPWEERYTSFYRARNICPGMYVHIYLYSAASLPPRDKTPIVQHTRTYIYLVYPVMQDSKEFDVCWCLMLLPSTFNWVCKFFFYFVHESNRASTARSKSTRTYNTASYYMLQHLNNFSSYLYLPTRQFCILFNLRKCRLGKIKKNMQISTYTILFHHFYLCKV